MNPAQLLMIDLSGPALTADERGFLQANPIGGVCLFRRNIRDRFQLADYTAGLRELLGDEILIAIDQEGGSVVRLPDVPYGPGAMALGAANRLELTRQVAAATARGLRAVGVTVNFAPVADVNNNPRNPVISERAFGSEPERVAAQVAAFVQGHQAEGVAATVKHFPGHGDTDIDSHLDLPRLMVGLERLQRVELVPFKAAFAAGVAAVMSFHGLVTALDPNEPATLSPQVMTGLLRDKLGFDGVSFSDALDMRAITARYQPAEATVRALAAGIDMPVQLGPVSQHEATIRGLEQALTAGRLDPLALGLSLTRVRRLARRYPAQPDPASAWQDGDEALLSEAAQRAVTVVGTLRPLAAGEQVVLVTATNAVGGAASDVIDSPAEALARRLEGLGLTVLRAHYQRSAPLAASEPVLSAVRAVGRALFVSTARLRMTQDEAKLGAEVAGATSEFAHVALYNPYHVQDLPGPAVVSFSFHPYAIAAVADVLLGRPAEGRLPIALTPA